jgi:hypothetical protein
MQPQASRSSNASSPRSAPSRRPKEKAATTAGNGQPLDDRVSALRSALRSAPRKRDAPSRSALKAAIVAVLPDLLAFRAKGYSDEELASVMRDYGFPIAASTLGKYVGEARARSKPRKKKAVAQSSAPPVRAPHAERAPPSARTPPAAKVGARNAKTAAVKSAKDVLGHLFDEDV